MNIRQREFEISGTDVECPECKNKDTKRWLCSKCNTTGKVDWITALTNKRLGEFINTSSINWSIRLPSKII